MNTSKLKARELITTAIFTVVFMIVTFACVMVTSITVFTYPLLASASGLLCGIIWLYMRLRVPKRFTVLLQSVICALLFFVVGAGWFVALGILIGGIFAEVITSLGKYKSFKLTAIAYAVYGFCFHWGSFLVVIISREYYIEYAVANGTNRQLIDTLLPMMSWQFLLIGSILCIVFSVIGMLLGKTLLKKHFVKAGMV